MNIEKSALDKLGIHELRDLARQVGVHLPTTYKREDLYKEIEAILSGEKEPYKKKNNQGRPPKVVRSTDITEILLPTEEKEFVLNTNTAESVLTFNESDIVLADTNEVDFAGYVKIINNYGVVRTKTLDIVFLTYAIISKYNLQTGDYIYGFYKQSTDKKNISTSVLKINNLSVNNYVRPEVKLINNKQHINVLGYDILIGGTNLVCANGIAYDIASQLKNNYQVVLLNINSKDSNLYYNDNGFNVVNINFNMSDKDIYEISELAFDAVKTLSCQGKHMIVVANSLTSLIKAHNMCLTGSFSVDTIKSEVIKNIKNIMMYSYAAESSSLTIIDVENTNIQKCLSEVLNYEMIDFFDSVNN